MPRQIKAELRFLGWATIPRFWVLPPGIILLRLELSAKIGYATKPGLWIVVDSGGTMETWSLFI